MLDCWGDDLLGYQKIGDSFTNLIATLDETKVISIEAGFGRGKTFFRTAWAQQLRNAGEIVVEIDAQKSDHTGDPLVTLLAALVEELPNKERSRSSQVFENAKKIGAVGGGAVVRSVLKAGADEIIELVSERAIDRIGDFDALDEIIDDLGDGMSKAAGQMIAAQMAAERVRKIELPKQLKTLHSALTEGSVKKRVVIIVDELDRCHPSYAIAVMEAMKPIFGQSGFIFCLMVNPEYLENLAQHQFGTSEGEEKYLDKFVDLRFRLEPQETDLKEATIQLAQRLPLKIPFGEAEAFSIGVAAKLAGALALETKLSMRKIK